MILFFIILFYSLYTINNKLIKFRIIKDPIINSEELIDYNYLKNKYKINNNHFNMINYDLCKECKKENKCYDSNIELCVPCKNNETCEKIYGK
jgi:hypothetical protein